MSAFDQPPRIVLTAPSVESSVTGQDDEQLVEKLHEPAHTSTPAPPKVTSTSVSITIDRKTLDGTTATASFFRIEIPLDPDPNEDPDIIAGLKRVEALAERAFGEEKFDALCDPKDLLAFLEKLIVFRDDGEVVLWDDSDEDLGFHTGSDAEDSDDSDASVGSVVSVASDASWTRNFWVD